MPLVVRFFQGFMILKEIKRSQVLSAEDKHERARRYLGHSYAKVFCLA